MIEEYIAFPDEITNGKKILNCFSYAKEVLFSD
jgi:hypothetical protein